MRTRHRKVSPPVCTPKFQIGQRVRISQAGVELQIAPAGTMGTVEYCGWAVAVRIDGAQHPHSYAPDFWEEAGMIKE